MIVALIVVMDKKGGIAKGGKLPWHLSTDLKRFKTLTMGHCILMGRKTFESIGVPLPGRVSIIITRNPNYHPKDCLTADSLVQALLLAEQRGETEALVIGGGEIFAQALPLAQRIYLTRVHTDTKADIFFPRMDDSQWTVVSTEEVVAGEQDEYATTFNVLARKNI
jgi:dihydrofolate reductase